MVNRQKQIEKTGCLTNHKIGALIANKHPQLCHEIIKSIFEVNNGLIVNPTIRARTISTIKYDDLLTNIIRDEHLMVFNRHNKSINVNNKCLQFIVDES